MSDFKETQHGRNHGPLGSDPIRGYIAYKVLNVGPWLEVKTTGASTLSGYGIHFDDAGGFGFLIDSDGGPLDFNVGSTTWHTTGNNVWKLDGGARIEPGGPTSDSALEMGGGYTFTLETGASVLVRDHLGAAIFEVREDGSVHIRTGTSIVADL